MRNYFSRPAAVVTCLLFTGLCLSCSQKENGKTDSKDAELQIIQEEISAVRSEAVLPRIIAAYNVTKPSHLASDYDLGYTFFVISSTGILLTEDASTEYDYRVNWRDTHLNDFSDSGAVVGFGDAVNLNSVSDTIKLGRILVSSRPGALVDVPFELSKKSESRGLLSVRCETLLVDSLGIICALGFSSKPLK